MREVLFRGKRANDGAWIEGFYLNRTNDEEDIHCIMEKFPVTIGKKVIPETVGQFTGLQDENGKRIFEGDIVAGLILHNMPIRAVVAFQEGAFGLDWQRGEVRVFTAFTSFCNTVFKVIGNIHDNPDLLKGE